VLRLCKRRDCTLSNHAAGAEISKPFFCSKLVFTREFTESKGLTSESVQYIENDVEQARLAAEAEIEKRNKELQVYREQLAKLEANIHLSEVLAAGGSAGLSSQAIQKDPLQSQLDELMQARNQVFAHLRSPACYFLCS
jgi:hypothetical protein